MPYISDYGARPWSEVINEVGGGIRGAIEKRQATDAADELKAKGEAEQNRALHPATQKWLQKVLSGEMSPTEAAVAAHQEIDAGQAPASAGSTQAPDPSMMGSGGKLGESGNDQGQMPPTPQPQQGLRAAVSQPQRPLTVRDAGDIEKLAPVMAASQRRSGTGVSETDAETRIRLKGEEERKTLTEKEKGRNTRAGNAITSRENMQQRQLDARAAEAVVRHEDRISALSNALDIAIRSNASAAQVAGIKAEAALIASDDSSVAKELSSIMRDESVSEDTRRLAADANNRRAELRARIGSAQPVPSYGGAGQPEGPAAPGVPLDTPTIPGGENLPPEIPNLGVPAKSPAAMQQPGKKPLPVTVPVSEPPNTYGAAVPDPSALPARSEGSVKMKFPDGSVHVVSADKVAKAKIKGGVEVK